MVVFESRNLDFLLNADRLNAIMIMLLLYFVNVFIFLYVPSQARKRKNALDITNVVPKPIRAAMVLVLSAVLMLKLTCAGVMISSVCSVASMLSMHRIRGWPSPLKGVNRGSGRAATINQNRIG